MTALNELGPSLFADLISASELLPSQKDLPTYIDEVDFPCTPIEAYSVLLHCLKDAVIVDSIDVQRCKERIAKLADSSLPTEHAIELPILIDNLRSSTAAVSSLETARTLSFWLFDVDAQINF